MNESKIRGHRSARKVGAIGDYPVQSMADVGALDSIGITFAPRTLDAMYAAYKGGANMVGGAMDSNLVAPLTTPSVATPIQFLQAWMPGFVFVTTRDKAIDRLVGETTIGSFKDEEIVQGYAERTGNPSLYQDNTNVPMSSWNANWERRTIVRHEEGMQVGFLEEQRAAAMNFSSAAEKRVAAVQGLEVQRNYIGFYGFNNGLGRTYGFLNDPSLPAYTNLPNGASGSSTFASKTTLEIIADILSALNQLRVQSGNVIDPKRTPIILALGPSSVDYLSTPTTLGYSVQEWLQKNYGNVRIESAPELDGANGGANVFYLYAESYPEGSTDDGKVFVQMVPAKFITVGAQQLTKGYEEVFANATAGVMTKRPFAVVRKSGA